MNAMKKLEQLIKIEQFIWENIDNFEKYITSLNSYIFINDKLHISLQPNIEELESIISSNYNSKHISVCFSDSLSLREIRKDMFSIDSQRIIDKLKEKLADEIKLSREIRLANIKPKEVDEDLDIDARDRFIENYLSK